MCFLFPYYFNIYYSGHIRFYISRQISSAIFVLEGNRTRCNCSNRLDALHGPFRGVSLNASNRIVLVDLPLFLERTLRLHR